MNANATNTTSCQMSANPSSTSATDQSPTSDNCCTGAKNKTRIPRSALNQAQVSHPAAYIQPQNKLHRAARASVVGPFIDTQVLVLRYVLLGAHQLRTPHEARAVWNRVRTTGLGLHAWPYPHDTCVAAAQLIRACVSNPASMYARANDDQLIKHSAARSPPSLHTQLP